MIHVMWVPLGTRLWMVNQSSLLSTEILVKAVHCPTFLVKGSLVAPVPANSTLR